jgi:FlaA1/EpsC-like NDP-sugar epimerase
MTHKSVCFDRLARTDDGASMTGDFVLVTGASGFIGSHVVLALLEGKLHSTVV